MTCDDTQKPDSYFAVNRIQGDLSVLKLKSILSCCCVIEQNCAGKRKREKKIEKANLCNYSYPIRFYHKKMFNIRISTYGIHAPARCTCNRTEKKNNILSNGPVKLSIPLYKCIYSTWMKNVDNVEDEARLAANPEIIKRSRSVNFKQVSSILASSMSFIRELYYKCTRC